MASIDKNQAVIDFLLTCPAILENPLFFNFLSAKDNTKQIIIQSNDRMSNKAYIDGTVMKRFTFTLIDFRSVVYEPLPKVPGYTNENVEEMLDVQGVMDWVNEQGRAGNYPNFGIDCFIDDMRTTTDNPNLNGVDTNVSPALAKYSMTIQIDYIDATRTIWDK